MKQVNPANFGLLIAFVLPGFIALWGVEPWSPVIATWLRGTSAEGATVGGFLYVTVASVGVGQIVSTIRWLLIDSLHHATGIPQPELKFNRLNDAVAGLEQLIEMHYRHYQWHANGLIAVSFCCLMRSAATDVSATLLLLGGGINVVLFVGSRDTLRKYYRRTEELLTAD